jgi:hypothetical protein
MSTFRLSNPLRRRPSLATLIVCASWMLVARSLGGCGGAQFTAGTADGGGGGGGDGGGSDAATDAGDAGSGFCAQHGAAAFCSDFDDSAFPLPWDGLAKNPTNGNSAGSADGTDPTTTSPPNSFLATVPAIPLPTTAGNLPTGVVLSKHGLPRTDVYIAFDLKLDKLSFPTQGGPGTAPPGLVVAAIVQGPPGASGTYSLNLALYPTSSAPYAAAIVEVPAAGGDAGSPQSYPLSSVPPAGTWAHFNLAITTVAGNSQITVMMNSNTKKIDAFALHPGGAFLLDRTLDIGALANGPTGDIDVRFDNVLVSTKAL